MMHFQHYINDVGEGVVPKREREREWREGQGYVVWKEYT